MDTGIQKTNSPIWSPTIKLIVGLTFVAIAGAVLIRFHHIIGPILVAIILTYLLHPLVKRISKIFNISWKSSVNIVYILLIALLVYFSLILSLAVFDQTMSLLKVLDTFLARLPNSIDSLTPKIQTFFNSKALDLDVNTLLNSLTQEIVSVFQPLIGRAGKLISTLASRTVSVFGWLVFILLVSYFILSDAFRITGKKTRFSLDTYNIDIQRLGSELRQIWNAFLRGQLILFGFTIAIFFAILSMLGIRNAIALAILAGFSRFMPYIGPVITWIALAIVAYFQNYNYWGLDQLQFCLLAVAVAILVDQIMDNLVTPRFLGRTLGVHPAGVLIIAIIAANLIGIIGLILAAPVLATLQLVGIYTIRKMLDLDPFPEVETPPEAVAIPGVEWTRKWINRIISRWKVRRRS